MVMKINDPNRALKTPPTAMLEHFRVYLLGVRFKLVTDHKSLTHIFKNPWSKPTPRLERRSLRLEPYDFDLVLLEE